MSFERPKKLEERDFILNPVKDFIRAVIGTETRNFLPDFAVKVKLTSNENIRVAETEGRNVRDNLPGTDTLNKAKIENKGLSFPPQTLVATYPWLPTH